MFCACIAIILCTAIVAGGVAVSIVDVSRYDFGLYYALLAIVGLTAAVTVCVVRPKHCLRDPQWYVRLCDGFRRCLLSEQYRRKRASRTRRKNKGDDAGSNRQKRATLNMLKPAVELMQHMLRGMATVDEYDDNDDDMDGEECESGSIENDSGRRSPRSGEKGKKKRKKKKHKSANDVGLYTILELSTNDVTGVHHTEATSVITVHEHYPQPCLLTGHPATTASGFLAPPNSLPIRASPKKLVCTPPSTPSPTGSFTVDEIRITFNKHDVVNETVSEERTSEIRSSTGDLRNEASQVDELKN